MGGVLYIDLIQIRIYLREERKESGGKREWEREESGGRREIKREEEKEEEGGRERDRGREIGGEEEGAKSDRVREGEETATIAEKKKLSMMPFTMLLSHTPFS